MKISYISLKKKFEEYKENKKKQKEDSEKETKYIGINYSKSDKENERKVKKIIQNLKSAPKGSYTLIIFISLYQYRFAIISLLSIFYFFITKRSIN